jgi:cytochrome c oxidase subunit 4
MSSETTSAHHDGEHGEHETMTRKKIWNVFFILLAITCVEFFIALYLVPNGHMSIKIANPVYIVLTLAKAFYIVAYFMHLKFEKLGLALSIIIPVIFIVGLILVLTNESHYWFDMR